jgi:hypothetical protein
VLALRRRLFGDGSMATNAFKRDRAEEEQNTSTWKFGNALSHGQLAIQRLQYGNAVPVALTFSMNNTLGVFPNEPELLV